MGIAALRSKFILVVTYDAQTKVSCFYFLKKGLKSALKSTMDTLSGNILCRPKV